MEIQCIVFLPFHTYQMKSSIIAFAHIEHIKTESNKFDLAVKSLYTKIQGNHFGGGGWGP